MTTRTERNSYARGYQAGLRRQWPAYQPPMPPDELVRKVMETAEALNNAVATWCGAFGPDDDFSLEMRPKMDALDAAFSHITSWVKQPPSGAAKL